MSSDKKALDDLLVDQPKAAVFHESDMSRFTIAPYISLVDERIEQVIANLRGDVDDKIIIQQVSNYEGMPARGLVMVLLNLSDITIDTDSKIVDKGNISLVIARDQLDERDRYDLYRTFPFLMPALAETVEQNLNNSGDVMFIIQVNSQAAENPEDMHCLPFATIRQGVLMPALDQAQEIAIPLASTSVLGKRKETTRLTRRQSKRIKARERYHQRHK